jgi:hypothetical protein
VTDPVLVVNLLVSLEWSAQLGCHDLDMFCNIAVLSCVWMSRLKEKDIAPVHVPAGSLTKGSERAVVQKLPPMTLAVPKRVVRSLTVGKVAVSLGSENRREGSAGIVLRGVSDTPATVKPGPLATLVPADALLAVEGSQRTQWLALL